RHFAETIPGPQRCDLDSRSVFRHENVRCAAQQHEHGVAGGAFLYHWFATTEIIEARLLDQMIELFIGKTLKERFATQDGQCLGLVFLYGARCFARSEE